jgi:hypothetical protein
MGTKPKVHPMPNDSHLHRVQTILAEHEHLITRPNPEKLGGNGIFHRYSHPVLTRDQVPPHWRFDFNPATNPRLLERLGVNAVFNAEEIKSSRRVGLHQPGTVVAVMVVAVHDARLVDVG